MIQVTIIMMEVLTLYIVQRLSMSLRKMMGMEGGIDNLEFEIKPKTLAFEGAVVEQFAIYLEKGAQVVGSFHSGNKHQKKDNLYRFKYPEPAIFRLKNINHAAYSWNFYSINPDEGSEDYRDSVSLNLKRTIELYEIELQEKEREIQTSFKERNPERSIVLDLWKKAKREMRNTRTSLKCIFPKLDMHLQFQLDIKNSLDLDIQREQRTKEREMNRSNSQPTVALEASTPTPKIADPPLNEEQGTQVAHQTKGKHMKLQKRSSAHKLTQEAENEAVVKVMNPKGVELEEDKSENIQEKVNKLKELNKLPPGSKKFSKLSDIIQRSHEGSSSFGGPDIINSSGRFQDRIVSNNSIDDLEPKNKVTVDSPLLNKFKTLPHDNYDNRFLKTQGKVDLRRARTAEKDELKIEENQYESIEDDIEKGEQTKDSWDVSRLKKQKMSTSGDPYARYIFIVALLVILGFLGQTWYKTKGRPSKKVRPIKAKVTTKA